MLSGPLGFESVFLPNVSSHHVLSSSTSSEPSVALSDALSPLGGLSTFGLQCSTFINPRSLRPMCFWPSLRNSTPKGAWRMRASYLPSGPYKTLLCPLSSCTRLAPVFNWRPAPVNAHAAASLYLSFRAPLPCLSSIWPFWRFSSSKVTHTTPDLRKEIVRGNLISSFFETGFSIIASN